jgi:hypothetical protein
MRPVQPAAPDAGELLHVSCLSTNLCEAVGFRFNPKVRNSDRLVAQLWDGMHWTLQKVTNQ